MAINFVQSNDITSCKFNLLDIQIYSSYFSNYSFLSYWNGEKDLARGQVQSESQRKHQAEKCRDVPSLGGRGEEDVFKNILGLLRQEMMKDPKNSVLRGTCMTVMKDE